MDKLLVIGSNGLVGSRIRSKASSYGFEAFGTHHQSDPIGSNSTRLDITDRQAVLNLSTRLRPKAIINTAALTNVDFCETNPEEADDVNVNGVRNLADAAVENNARLVQISTDSVFDGARGNYAETDVPHPINHYSVTKLKSEEIVSHVSSYAIARPSVVYGWHSGATKASDSPTKPMNFAMFVLDKLGRNEGIRAVRDQYSSPTLADNLADAILRLAKGHENGIFHTAGRACLSRYEFALTICSVFEYATNLVRPVFSSEFPQKAPRPKNCCLQIGKAEALLKMRFLTAAEGLSEMRRQMAEKTGRNFPTDPR